jgi:altronate dehydratase
VTWHATALAPTDNVAVMLQPVAAGEGVVVKRADGTVEVRANEPIALCHKIALADIAPGDPVIKYGECIGEATVRIARGSWVHIHNVRSRRGRAAQA